MFSNSHSDISDYAFRPDDVVNFLKMKWAKTANFDISHSKCVLLVANDPERLVEVWRGYRCSAITSLRHSRATEQTFDKQLAGFGHLSVISAYSLLKQQLYSYLPT
jgi:hypothetical protein